MNNLISTCYVVAIFGKVEPVIYLKMPNFNPDVEKVFQFATPFHAKSFLRHWVSVTDRVAINHDGNRTTSENPVYVPETGTQPY